MLSSQSEFNHKTFKKSSTTNGEGANSRKFKSVFGLEKSSIPYTDGEIIDQKTKGMITNRLRLNENTEEKLFKMSKKMSAMLEGCTPMMNTVSRTKKRRRSYRCSMVAYNSKRGIINPSKRSI